MCGPSGSEKSLAASEQSFSNLLQADFGERFANQDAVLSKLNQSLSPIVSAGPSQQGMSAAELAALNTEAIDVAGAAARNARQAAGNAVAGQNNTSGLTSGVTRQINAAIDSNSANQLATAQNAITRANYDQGSNNYWRAVGGAQALSQGYDPSAFSGQAINANQNAFGEAKTVQDQNNAAQAAIAGGIASAIPGFAGVASGITSAISPNADTGVLDAIAAF